tara:strand:+ start:1411 stop:1659 length:249 start_codon:yes stop_codon:yes gene_type:complete
MKVCLETREGKILDICTCPNEEKVIRAIVLGYEEIWGNTIELGHTSNDPIVTNWESSEILVENVDHPGEFHEWANDFRVKGM